jgi:hypothetical protein
MRTPTSGVKTPELPEAIGTAEAVPSRSHTEKRLLTGAHWSGLIAPEKRDVVNVEIPREGEEDGGAQEGPEEEADWEGAHERNFGDLGFAKKDATGQANASGKSDAREGSNQTILPSGGRDKKGGVQQSVERDVAEDEGNGSA